MHGRVSPSFIEEPPTPVKMVKVIGIRLAAPKLHVRDLEIRPEVTCRIPVRNFIMLRPPFAIFQPRSRITVVVFQILRMRVQEFECLRPQRRHRGGGIVEADCETVGLVVVLHVAEDIIVDIAEEMHLRLHAPVIPRVGERGMPVEHPAVPATHLVVAHHPRVLHVLPAQQLRGFLVERLVDPGGDGPVILGDEVVGAGSVCGGGGEIFELLGEGFVIEEGPGVVELVVPGRFEVAHRLQHPIQLFVADEGEDGGVDPGAGGGVGSVGGVGAVERGRGLVRFCYLIRKVS